MTLLRITRLPALAAVSAVALTAYSSGPTDRVGDVSGSPFAAANACANCHNGGSLTPETTLELVGADGTSRDAYVPGATYTLRVAVTGADEAGGYGFQAVVLDGADVQAGVFGDDAPDGTRVAPLARRSYFEHSRRREDSTAEISWTAPAAGTGDVTVYAAGNAVNGNGNISGDNVDLAAVTFAEDTDTDTDTGTTAVSGVISSDWGASSASPGLLRVRLPADLGTGARVSVVDPAGRTLVQRDAAGEEMHLWVPVGAGVLAVHLAAADGRRGVRRVFAL